MLQAYGMMLGARLLLRRRYRFAARRLITPVSYWRSREYECVWSGGNFREGDAVLDIGSPKLLALYLADRVGAEVWATDISDSFVEEMTLARHVKGVAPTRLHIEIEDGRDLSYDDRSFDTVYAISVVEHIPEAGDTECLRESERVLKPGGTCLVTVPFRPESSIDYVDADTELGWRDFTTQSDDGRVFFQRVYDEHDLHERLVAPSRLRLRSIRFIGERFLPTHRLAEDYMSPYVGPVQPLLAKALLTKPAHSWRELAKPLAAFLVLEKPADS